MTYAAVILKEKDKKYQSTVTQTQFFNNNKSQAVMNKIQLQTSIKHSSKHEKETDTSNSQKPIVQKAAFYKKSIEVTSFEKHTTNQNQNLNS